MPLKEYYHEQQKIFQPALDEPKPDYLDVEHVSMREIEDYITRYTFKRLCAMQDELGLRSPAQKAYEDTRLELLRRRTEPAWLYGPEGKRAIATMLYAKAFLDAKIPAEFQKKAFSAQGLQNGVNSIVENRLRTFVNPADMDSLAAEALRHRGLFKKTAAILTAQLAEPYRRAAEEHRKKQAIYDCAKGFALDKAAKILNLSSNTQTCSERNPELQEKAKLLMKDNDFKEILRRIMAGKTVEEIRALHNGKLDLNSLNMPLFEREEAKLGYEKRCAAVAAEAALQREKAAPSREEIDQMAAALRKNESFRAFMRGKPSSLTI